MSFCDSIMLEGHPFQFFTNFKCLILKFIAKCSVQILPRSHLLLRWLWAQLTMKLSLRVPTMNTNLKVGAIIVSEFMDIQYVLYKKE
jgi:hypothetical protein